MPVLLTIILRAIAKCRSPGLVELTIAPSVSASQARSLSTLLNRLETALIKEGLARPEQFPPGLDAQTIRERTAALPFAFPDELMTLYEWHDGVRAMLSPATLFMSLEDSLRLYELEIKPVADPWEADWFPIFNYGGCVSFIRCGPVDPGALWYWCAEFNDLGWSADSLLDEVEWMARVYEEGASYVHARKGRAIDARKSAAILRNMDIQPRDVKSMVAALTAEDPLQRMKAFGRLICYQYPDALDPVLELLRADEHDIVEAAAKIIASYGRAETIASLIKMAAHWEGRAHRMGNPVLYQLFRYDEDELTLLTDALHDDDDELRAAAATCLGALNDARAFTALHTASSDPSPTVRFAARDALKRMQRR